MPVLTQCRIHRADLRANRSVLYLFGDNALRRGMGGQALEARGEPNAVGVRTKYAPSMAPASFFRDDDAAVAAQCAMIDEDLAPVFEHVRACGIVVVPVDGLGTGLAQLDVRSPRTRAYLDDALGRLRDAAGGEA